MLGAHEVDWWNVDDMRCRFIKACTKENAGVLALAVCIAGNVDPLDALHAFCGLPEKKHFKLRNGIEKFDYLKLLEILQQRNMLQKDFCKMIGISTSYFSGIRYESKGQPYCNKRKSFIEKCEKALGLEEGSLVYKE